MTIVSTLGKILGNFIFITSLSSLILVIALSEFTAYDNLLPIVTNIFKQALEKPDPQALELFYQNSSLQCKTTGQEFIEISLGEGDLGRAIKLKCSDVQASGAEKIGDLLAKQYFDSIYYEKFDCEFIDCFTRLDFNTQVRFILSNHGNQTFSNLVPILIIATIAGIILVYISTRNILSTAKSIGMGSILIGLGYFITEFGKSVLLSLTSSDIGQVAQPAIDNLLGLISIKFLYTLIVGIIIVVLAYLLKHFLPRK